jgi:AmiR/NasT family two-component response regulator
VIARAIGILMERHRIDADSAWDLLAKTSQRSNRKVREVAAELQEAADG